MGVVCFPRVADFNPVCPCLPAEAEARFLRLERRLRAVLTHIVASDPGMEAFLAAVETLLRGFAQVSRVCVCVYRMHPTCGMGGAY